MSIPSHAGQGAVMRQADSGIPYLPTTRLRIQVQVTFANPADLISRTTVFPDTTAVFHPFEVAFPPTLLPQCLDSVLDLP